MGTKKGSRLSIDHADETQGIFFVSEDGAENQSLNYWTEQAVSFTVYHTGNTDIRSQYTC